MKHILDKFRKNLKIAPKLLAGLAIVATGLSFGATLTDGQAHALDQTWGPQDRTRFTWNSPATYPTFNSMTDNPFIGDESNFVRVKEYVAGQEGGHTDNVTVEPGKEYEVWIYFHNNAGANYNQSGQGLADNTRIATSFPSRLTAGDSGIIRGSVSATNANPEAVWDTAFFNADTTVYLSYVPETAILHYNDYNNNGTTTSHNCTSANGIQLGANIFADSSEVGNSTTAGAKITCYNNEEAWGIIPGCNEYAGYVTYRVKADQPKFWTEKTVSPAGADTWTESITANPGDELDFKIFYKNTGTTEQTDVNMHDELPAQLTLVPDTMHFVSTMVPEGLDLNAENQAKLFSDTGLNIDNYRPGESATLTYRVKLDSNLDNYTCGANVLFNNVEVETANGSELDKVRITVNKNCDDGGDSTTKPTCATNPELPGCKENSTTKPTCITNPELPGCQEIVKTGPAEIALAAAILAGIGGTTVYLIRTRRVLSRVEKTVTGKAKKKTDGLSNPKDKIYPDKEA